MVSSSFKFPCRRFLTGVQDNFWYDISQLWETLGNVVLLVTAIALFTLSTVQAVLNLILGAADIDNIDIPYDNINRAAGIIYGVNNIIADGLVIYRCYIVWDRKVYVIILPLLMLLVTSVFGVDLQLPSNPFFALSLATNVIVTALTERISKNGSLAIAATSWLVWPFLGSFGPFLVKRANLRAGL
ncbi:hypothetical protein DFH06DRAFT_1150561 [Mycena polygramma]|nr:hypothetical protein DFH06DRAFT_1150561 [Mycena polygramma]